MTECIKKCKHTKENTMSSIADWKSSLIMQHYATGDLKWLSKETGMKIGAICGWARKRKLRRQVRTKTKPSHAITDEQWKLIFEMYPTGDLDLLSQKLNKNKHAIGELARRKGLKRLVNSNRNGDLSILLDGSLMSMYYLGFIAADGYITKTGHFMLSQSIKDKDSVDKMAEYLKTSVTEINGKNSGFNKSSTCYRISICDQNIGVQIRQMFGLKDDQTKAYDGINLDFIKTEEQAAAFFIGCLNGDGSRNQGSFRIECYETWFEVYKKLLQKLPENMQNILILIGYKNTHKKNYCRVSTRKSTTDALVNFAKLHKLPLAERKLNPKG